MADEKNNVSIDPKDVERAKAMAELFEKIEEVVDRTRGITKKKRELAEQEKRYTEETLDLTKRIETRKQKILQLEGSLAKELGVYQKIQKNIAENESKLANSEYKSDIIKDQIKQQNIMLAQKQAQFQQEIASGKITERTAAARRREIGSIKDLIKAKEREGKQEEYIQSILNKKIGSGFIAERQQKILVDKLERELKLEKTGLSNDEQALKLLKKQQEEHNRINELKEKISRIGKEIENNLLSESKGYQKIKGLVTDIAKNGLKAYLAVVKASLDRWKELDAAALSFRQTTGFLTSQTKELDKAAREVNVQMAQLGVTIGDAYAAASALTNEFQVIGLVTKEAIANTAMMAANLGLNVQDAAKFKGLFESISESVGSSGDSMIKSAAALAEMAGVAPRAVLNDMANASEETLAFLAKSPMALIRATVEARRLGTTVNSLSKSARGFLNYQDSITSELEASALIGKSLNFQEARAAAYAGDVVKSRALALKQIEKAGDFTKLNVYQQEALAKAAGMTTGEIIKQQNQQKLLAKLEQTRPELYKKYMEMQEKIKENEKAAAEDLERQAEEMAKRELMQGELNKLTNAFDAIWTNISDSLLAIANTIMPPIVFFARLLAATFKVIGGFIRGILKPFDSIMEKFRSGNSSALKLEEVFVKINAAADYLAKAMEKVGVPFGYVIMLGNQFFLVLYGALNILSLVSNKVKVAFNPLKTVGNILLNISRWFTSIGDKATGIFKIFKPFTSLFSTVFKVFSVVAKFLGPIGLIINAVQVLWEFGKSLIEIWSSDDMNIFEKIIASLVALPKAIWNGLVQPIIDNVAWVLNKIWPGMGDGLINGIQAIGNAIFGLLKWPFQKFFGWFKDDSGIAGQSPSEIGLMLVDGIKSIGGMLLDALTLPFRSVVNFVSKIFDGDGSVGDSIVNGIKNVMGGIFNILTSPFKSAFEFIKKIPLIGKLFGQGDATATVNNEIKSTVEKQVAMAVEVKNINELKETVDKLTEAISKLGGTAGGASPVVNVNNNQNAMIEKLDELIGLLKDGAIAVNMDGILVSRTLAKTS